MYNIEVYKNFFIICSRNNVIKNLPSSLPRRLVASSSRRFLVASSVLFYNKKPTFLVASSVLFYNKKPTFLVASLPRRCFFIIKNLPSCKVLQLVCGAVRCGAVRVSVYCFIFFAAAAAIHASLICLTTSTRSFTRASAVMNATSS